MVNLHRTIAARNKSRQHPNTGMDSDFTTTDNDALDPYKSRQTWCAATEDHDHVDSEPEIVGQSWHGPVRFWHCIKCGYKFGDH